MNQKELNWLLQTIKDPRMRSDSSLRSTRAAEFHFNKWPN